ncbi:MAG: type IV pilin N-terminal domain-containing protein [Methanomassiliicoccus sp.]|nr:type IV pilin N-terminal domain-containing protein [Methanomassiliicoccus sp.]
MKKMWKNRSGVSPVIATILLVAITVVLSSALYLYAMSLGGTGSSAPSGAYASAQTLDAKSIKFNLGTMSRDVEFTECRFVVGLNDVVASAQAVIGTGPGNALTFTPVEGGATFTVTFVDLKEDGKISMGDYAEIVTSENALTPGVYTAYLLWAQDGSPICTMTLPL